MSTLRPKMREAIDNAIAELNRLHPKGHCFLDSGCPTRHAIHLLREELQAEDATESEGPEFRTYDHPQANGRAPQAGETEYPLRFTLEDGRLLTVRIGERGFQAMTQILMDMLARAPSHSDGSMSQEWRDALTKAMAERDALRANFENSQALNAELLETNGKVIQERDALRLCVADVSDRDNKAIALDHCRAELAATRKELELERYLSDAIKRADQATAPCGHNQQYCWSPDGKGKRIICLLCERERKPKFGVQVRRWLSRSYDLSHC